MLSFESNLVTSVSLKFVFISNYSILPFTIASFFLIKYIYFKIDKIKANSFCQCQIEVQYCNYSPESSLHLHQLLAKKYFKFC